jgi:tetratricopeptide (TPR) repeat protein
VGSAIYADRYSYLTLLPIIVLLSIALVNIFQIFPRFRSITFSLILFSLLALGMLTHAQVRHWKTPITFWTHVLKLYPDAALAHRNISAAYNLMGYHEQALGHLEYISEQGWDVDQNLAGTLALSNQVPRALALYEKMVLSGKYTKEESEAFKLEIERLQRIDE